MFYKHFLKGQKIKVYSQTSKNAFVIMAVYLNPLKVLFLLLNTDKSRQILSKSILCDKVISIWGNVAASLIINHYNAEILVVDSNKDSFSL